MSIRLYVAGVTVAPISPAFDASWEATGLPTRRALVLGHDHSLVATVSVGVAEAVVTNPYDVAVVQAVSPPLAGAGTLAGAIKAIIRATESNAAADMRAQMVVRIVSNDGTVVRGTLIASNVAALSSEFPTGTAANRKFPLGWTGTGQVPTSVAYSAGDRIVVELGFRATNAVATSYTGTLVIGNPLESQFPDAAENETDAIANTVSWVEFADNLVFAAEVVRATQVYEEVLALPTNPEVRATQVYEEVLALPTAVPVRATQVYVEVLTGPKTAGLPDNSARASASISG